jgi:glycosyltransferase involved in cell wall biosynthesis
MGIRYPKISIISPSYNQGQFIEEAIRSVLEQDYNNFEHIIIDGGSTDNTLEILKKYPHLIWISESDDGQSDAINKGFRKATGDIIGWLNTDDYYLPNTFSIVSKVLSDEKVDAIYSNTRFVDTFGNITREMISPNSKKWASLFYCFIPSETFFFKREILRTGIFIDKHFHIAMDMEFFANLYYSGYRIQKVNAFFGHFRWHENNKSIETGLTKSIRIKESIEIFNRYSGFRLPMNKLGSFSYKTLVFFVGSFRTICRVLGVGLYRKK